MKVADFGIAHIETSNMTQVGTTLGTLAYMSPEQIMGLPVDGRSDLFSAGVILYQFLTGERPFSGTSTTTMRKVQLPSALPAVFASLRIAAPLALIGALLAEWLATGKGLGYLMLQSVTTFELDRMWSAVTLVTVASIILYSVISAVEQLALSRYSPDSTGRAF